MANLRLIKNRIKTARNIAQITKAMELVAASKMKKAQKQALKSRPYAEKILSALRRISQKTNPKLHPLLRKKQFKEKREWKIGLIIIAPSKGLCGSLLANLARAIALFIESKKKGKLPPKELMYETLILEEEILREDFIIQVENYKFEMITVEKKAKELVLKLGHNVIADFSKLSFPLTVETILPITKIISDTYLDDTFDEIYLAYAHFVNTMTQKPVVRKILPIEPEVFRETKEIINQEYLFEPSPKNVLHPLLKHFLEIQIYQTILEATASEHSARMVAMKNATDNAYEIINSLTLDYNKERQKVITNEIADITTAKMAVAQKI